MRRLHSLLIACVSVGPLAAGCGEEPDRIPRGTDPAGEEFKAQAAQIVNRYARGLYDRDRDAVLGVLSSEVKERMKTYEGGLDRFMEKQRKMMVQTFTAMEGGGIGAGFQVTRVAAQEGAAEATLSRDGRALTRPFHFVLEETGWKLNVARPGFSKPLAEGAAAANNYMIDNQAGHGVNAWCEGGGGAYVPPYSQRTVSCPNRCGYWFSGAWFDGTGWVGQTHLCDYNTWGADVINSRTFPYWGMACHDPC
jgi:hypothetical protein